MGLVIMYHGLKVRGYSKVPDVVLQLGVTSTCTGAATRIYNWFYDRIGALSRALAITRQ